MVVGGGSPRRAGHVCFGCGAMMVQGVAGKVATVERPKLNFWERQAMFRKMEKRRAKCPRCRALDRGDEERAKELSRGTDEQTFLAQVAPLRLKPSIIAHVVDATDFEGSLIRNIRMFVGKNPIVLVVTKCDLLPEPFEDARHRLRLQRYFRERVAAKGLNCTKIVLMSSVTKFGLEDLSHEILDNLNGRNVYLVGYVNVGKSSVLNALVEHLVEVIHFPGIPGLKRRDRLKQERVTCSALPGTTLGKVRVPCFESHRHALYDMPGIFPKRTHRWAETDPRRHARLDPLPLAPQMVPLPQCSDTYCLVFGGGLDLTIEVTEIENSAATESTYPCQCVWYSRARVSVRSVPRFCGTTRVSLRSPCLD